MVKSKEGDRVETNPQLVVKGVGLVISEQLKALFNVRE